MIAWLIFYDVLVVAKSLRLYCTKVDSAHAGTHTLIEVGPQGASLFFVDVVGIAHHEGLYEQARNKTSVRCNI